MSNEHERQWAERLEAGAEDDELLALAARLRQEGQATRPAPSLAFQRQLRRDLLNQYAANAPGRGTNVWRWAGSLAAVALLVAVVGLTWLSISSSGRPAFGGLAQVEPTASLPSRAEVAVEGQTIIVPPPPEGAIYMESYGYSANPGLTPGATLAFTGRWRIPADAANGPELTTFLHLRGDSGAIVAQADGPLTIEDDQTSSANASWSFQLNLALPDPLPPGDYLLVTGLVGADGQRMPVYDLTEGDEIVIGPVTIGRATFTEAKLTVLDVSPAAGTELSGAQPITFTVRLAYGAVTAPALLEVKINEVMGASGRGVATAQVTLDGATGEVSVPVVLHPAQELNAPAELGLWLQLRADAGSPPELIEMPEAYRWHYTP
jgi:hypothetical protein